ncbi:MAG: Tim44/TimA family putative adaptor protein [Stappiaceae bacterium]
MNEIFDVYNIIFLVLAVVIFFRLRSVLGRRTGNERPPYDPYEAKEAQKDSTGSNDNVISLPRQDNQEADGPGHEADINRIAPDGSALNEALKTIVAADRGFDPDNFVNGAKMAYEMIVTAFAEGDRKSLKNLLSNDVYEGFLSAIDDRESRKETVESTFVGIEKADIVEAALKSDTAQVTVRFKSQLISATKNTDGAVIDGDPNLVTDVTDIWTFSRDVSANDPNWKLVATEAAE